jgi:glycosyltransferase involved in cell wall biosynthesis
MGMSGRYLFTVFTPTYNRAATLPRVYRSLQAQSFRDFEWLIVDDGSTDETRSLVESWQREASFPIRYLWQEHAHKKTAVSRGVAEANGELFLSLDSDDEMFPATLATFRAIWLGIPEADRDRYSGVTGLCVYADGSIVGDRYPRSPLDSNSLENAHRWKIKGEKFGFQRTDILRKFSFPKDINGYVPEGVIWFAIARAGYITRYVNEVLRVYHQTEGSIVHVKRSLVAIRHAEGAAFAASEELSIDLRQWGLRDPIYFVKRAALYTCSRLALFEQRRAKTYPLRGILPRLLVLLMSPVGLAIYLLDRIRRTR